MMLMVTTCLEQTLLPWTLLKHGSMKYSLMFYRSALRLHLKESQSIYNKDSRIDRRDKVRGNNRRHASRNSFEYKLFI